MLTAKWQTCVQSHFKSGYPEVIQHSQHIFKKLLNPQLQNPLVKDIHTISAAENTEGDIFEKNIAKPNAHPVPIEVQSALDQANLKIVHCANFQTSIQTLRTLLRFPLHYCSLPFPLSLHTHYVTVPICSIIPRLLLYMTPLY